MSSEALSRLADEVVAVMEHDGPVDEKMATLTACHTRAGSDFADHLRLFLIGNPDGDVAGLQAVADETMLRFRDLMRDDYIAVGIPDALAYCSIKAFHDAFFARVKEHTGRGAAEGTA